MEVVGIMKRIFSRLRTTKFLGVRTVNPYIVSVLNDETIPQIIHKNTVKGVAYIQANDNVGALILQPQMSFGSQNLITGWSGSGGALYQINNAFRTSANGIGVSIDSQEVEPTEREIVSVWKLFANEGFYFQVYPYQTEEGNSHIAYQFGQWRIIFYADKIIVARVRSNWTLAQEKTALDNDDANLLGPYIAAGNNQPEQNTAAIFDVYVELDDNSDKQSLIGDYRTLWVLPEPHVGLHVSTNVNGFVSDKQQTFIPLPEGETGDIYPETSLTVYTRRNAMFFQIGTITFSDKQFQTKPLSTPYDSDTWNDTWLVGNIKYNTRLFRPEGTGALVQHNIINEKYFNFVVTMTTDSNHIYTPFFYSATASLMGGAYAGDTEFQLDTDDLRDTMGNSPVTDITPQCDGDMRRQQYEITLRSADKIQDKLFEYNGNPQSFMLENQVANLSMGESAGNLTPVITGGLITHCEAHDAANAAHSSSSNGFHKWTSMTVTLCDAWAILEDDVIYHEIPGDGMRLGEYVKVLLRNGGFGLSQININDADGRILPQAERGEQPCVMPREEQTRADYLRELFDLYAFDWQLYIDGNGIWQMRQRPTSLKTINGVPVAYSTDYRRVSDQTIPGRFAVLSALDWTRDFSEFYNHFRVEGAEVNGRQLCQEYTIQESIQGIHNVDNSNKYIGRYKPYPTVRNEGLRTDDDLQMALRSLVMRYGVSGRFLNFETFWQPGLYQWDRITVDGKPYAIWKVDGGSLASDRMNLQVIEL